MHTINAEYENPVVGALQSKQLPEKVPAKADLEEYGDPLPLLTLDISENMVEKVAQTMGGRAGPGSIDASQLKIWLKTYGGYSKKLQEGVELFI